MNQNHSNKTGISLNVIASKIASNYFSVAQNLASNKLKQLLDPRPLLQEGKKEIIIYRGEITNQLYAENFPTNKEQLFPIYKLTVEYFYNSDRLEYKILSWSAI